MKNVFLLAAVGAVAYGIHRVMTDDAVPAHATSKASESPAPSSTSAPSSIQPNPDPGIRATGGDTRNYWEIFSIDPDSRQPDIDILASVIASAKRTATPEEARAISWAALNAAIANGMPLREWLSLDRSGTEQEFSTTVAGTERDRLVASAVLESPKTYDMVSWSRRWIDVPAIERLHRADPSKPSAEEVRALLRSQQLSHVRTIGNLEFWSVY